MTTMKPATEHQIAGIRCRAVNATTLAIAEQGIVLTHEQADALGCEAIDWLRNRLGLRVQETSDGVEVTQP